MSHRNAFRQGLVQGEKPVIYPILQWLFQNMEDLKKRAYLARYLVRIDIPPEQLADQDISELNETVGFSNSTKKMNARIEWTKQVSVKALLVKLCHMNNDIVCKREL